jgi:hypothetical protein
MTSRVRTPRVLALAAAAALAGTPLLAGSPASAAEAVMPTASQASLNRSDGADTVTFNGGCGLLGSGLGGTSTPDATALRVPSGSGVRFANRLGQPATLLLNGEAVGEVPAGGSADVVFRKGPATASMQVSCMLGAAAGTVTIEVVRTDPSPSSPSEPSSPSSPERPNSRPPASGGKPSGGSTRVEPDATVEGVWWSDAVVPPAGKPADPRSRDGRDHRGRDNDHRGRWDHLQPVDGGSTYGEPATVDAESADGGATAQSMARTAGSTPDDGPIGFLALIATVCVVGVSAGAIRTLVTQRANRAEWA